jgi:hypothetical protein
MEPVSWDNTIHEKVDPAGLWVTGLRAKYNRPGLFLYRHRIFQTFVLAAWWLQPGQSTRKPSGVFCPIFVFEGKPDDLPPVLSPGLDKVPGGLKGYGFAATPHPDDVAEALRNAKDLQEDNERMLKEHERRRLAEKEENRAHLIEIGERLEKELPGLKGDHPDVQKMKKDGTLPQSLYVPGM